MSEFYLVINILLTRARALLPGITGLAQVQNIDMSTPALLAQTDRETGKIHEGH